jgi:hypothetical protein
MLLDRGMTERDLAEQIGYHPVHVRSVIAGLKSSRRARAKIEEALGAPFWSGPEEFCRRHRQTKTREHVVEPNKTVEVKCQQKSIS